MQVSIRPCQPLSLRLPQCPMRAVENRCEALHFGTIECRSGRRSWRLCGIIFPCGSSSSSPRPSWAECVTGRRRATILPRMTSFAACMPTIAPGALCSVMAGACTGWATARALLDRPARLTTSDKPATKPRPRPQLWPQPRPGLRLWFRIGCRLSSGNAQRRRRSNSDDPRRATSPPATGPRATSTSQPASSPRPRHQTPAPTPRCHLPDPASRRLPAPGTAQSAVRARQRQGSPTRAATTARRCARTRSHPIRTDPRRNRHHARHHADQIAMPSPVNPHQDHHDTVIDKPGKWWQAAQSTPTTKTATRSAPVPAPRPWPPCATPRPARNAPPESPTSPPEPAITSATAPAHWSPPRHHLTTLPAPCSPAGRLRTDTSGDQRTAKNDLQHRPPGTRSFTEQ
jgi:hypothetical protein